MRETAEDVDRNEYCPNCLKRSCRGCDKGNPLRPLFEEEDVPKEKAKPLRLTGWKPLEKAKEGRRNSRDGE